MEDVETIQNRTFDEISIGDTASLTRVLTKDDILLFAAVSGDVNPAHVDEEYARSEIFQKIIAHGMWGAALISTVLGTALPGPGTIYVGQTLRFRRPVAVGDRITVTVLSDYPIISTTHSHEAAAARAVAMGRGAEVDALMKGSLSTEELMQEVTDAETGLRTARQLSHVFALDVPNYPRPIFLTDAVVNVNPTVVDKRDIVQNAIDLLHAIGKELPKVAILAAFERVEPNVESTMAAAALCKMSDRGQITGAVLDGPLAFDTAVSPASIEEGGIQSPIAGSADILLLLVPDLEVGQMLFQQLESLAGVQAAGVVLGARIPIVLAGPGDTEGTLTASCALAAMMSHAHKRAEAIEKSVRPLPSA